MIEVIKGNELIYLTEQELNEGLNNGTIKEIIIKVDETIKRPYKSAETIYNEYQGAKTIRNGIYCKIIDSTYEAINEQSKIDDYVVYEFID